MFLGVKESLIFIMSVCIGYIRDRVELLSEETVTVFDLRAAQLY